MRKLRLVAIIIFGAWGGQALYKYLSDDGKIFVSREKLPESETVTNVATPVEVQETTSMDEYFAAHKDDIEEIVKKSLVEGPDSMEEYFQAHKNDVVEKVKEIIKNKVEAASPEPEPLPQMVEEVPEVKEKPIDKVAIYKPSSKKGCCKSYKAKYCVKIDHSRDNETPNEIIMRHFK